MEMFFHTAAKISIENTSVILKPLKRGKKAMFTPEDRRDMFLKACFLF